MPFPWALRYGKCPRSFTYWVVKKIQLLRDKVGALGNMTKADTKSLTDTRNNTQKMDTLDYNGPDVTVFTQVV